MAAGSCNYEKRLRWSSVIFIGKDRGYEVLPALIKAFPVYLYNEYGLKCKIQLPTKSLWKMNYAEFREVTQDVLTSVTELL